MTCQLSYITILNQIPEGGRYTTFNHGHLSYSVSLHLVLLFCPSPSLGLSHLHLSCSLFLYYTFTLSLSLFPFPSSSRDLSPSVSVSLSLSLYIISACLIYMYNNLIQGNSRQFLSFGHSLPCILTIVSRFNIITDGYNINILLIFYIKSGLNKSLCTFYNIYKKMF